MGAFTSSILMTLSLLAADQRPIPQDAARMEGQRRQKLEWHRRIFEGGYDRAGRKDPRWDAPARRAIDLAARYYAQQVDPLILHEEIQEPAAQAVAAGCDDPLVAYIRAFSTPVPDEAATAERDGRYRAAAEGVAASPYPPLLRARILYIPLTLRIAKSRLSGDDRVAAEKELDEIIRLLGPSAAQDPRGPLWEGFWYNVIDAVIKDHERLSGSLRAAHDRVDALLAKVDGVPALRAFVRGVTLRKLAWKARGTKFAPEVTDEQFRAFGDLLAQARGALLEAWKLDPDMPRLAHEMMPIELGAGDGDRQAVDLWFERAMLADGNDVAACSTMLDWLEPRWHGDPAGEQLLAFGKACAATRNWRNGLNLVYVDAIFRRYKLMEFKDWTNHFKDPEVWSQVSAAFDEYLRHYPYDDARRTQYATIGFWSGRYAEADAQYRALEGRLTPWQATPRSSMEQLRRFQARAAELAGPKK